MESSEGLKKFLGAEKSMGASATELPGLLRLCWHLTILSHTESYWIV